MRKPVALIIMDGYGISKKRKGNAISMADKPHIKYLKSYYPNSYLSASGEDVGLPEGQMGNSEVGHLNIGAGRVVYQSLSLINVSIRNKTFFDNEVLLEAINYAKKNNSKLHVFGLASDGGVHSHINHITALLDMAKDNGLEDVYVHAFLDGRDVGPKSAKKYLVELAKKAKVATVSGRYYSMDRDKNWNRVQKSYDAMVNGIGPKYELIEGLENSYKEGILDEFVIPYISDEKGIVSDNDAVVFANFRPDRAIELAQGISNPSITGLDIKNHPKNLLFASFTDYSNTINGDVAFHNIDLVNTLGDVLSNNDLKQLRIAETEKYAHVTFFFDGGEDREIKGSKRVLVNSPKVATYDLQPEMSAYEVTEKVLYEIENDCPDVMILNFANCDMVGHTAVKDAVISAVEVVDECVWKVVQAIKKKKGVCIITADHGNAEKILAEDGSTYTAHTTNHVPVIITDKKAKVKSGILADLAPTMLKYLGIAKPKEMTGNSLVEVEV